KHFRKKLWHFQWQQIYIGDQDQAKLTGHDSSHKLQPTCISGDLPKIHGQLGNLSGAKEDNEIITGVQHLGKEVPVRI
ncbi:hypothetical protein ACJX0J_026802, partial [Zea mays]